MSRSPNRTPSHRATLVTGGGGFVGSYLVEGLVARGDRVTVVDDFSTGRRENIAALADAHDVEIISGRVSEALPRFEPGMFDEIYHLAAAVGVRLVIDEPIHTIETNILETSAVLQFAAPTNTRLLITSTSEVYGKSTATPFAEDDDVVYGPTILHRWSYACSKAIDEYLALAWHRGHGLPVTIARLFNTVGPRQIGRYGMVLPRFVSAAMANAPLQVHGDGRQIRCFCDVRDVAAELPRMVGTPACEGRVFNVGSDNPIEIVELARLVIETLDSRSNIELVPYEQVFGAGFDDLRERRPDLTRIRETTGFTPSVPLRDTILDLARELQSRPPASVESTIP